MTSKYHKILCLQYAIRKYPLYHKETTFFNAMKSMIKGNKNRHIRNFFAKIYLTIQGIYYYGDKYRCPCCNKKFRKFLDFNYKRKIYNPKKYINTYKNTICPYCLSLPRHRIICEYLKSNQKLMRNKRILLFAPERGIKEFLKANDISFTTADLYREADFRIDITNIDFEDSTFDVVFCNHVLEHVDDYKKALKEVNRILTTGGTFICSVPVDTNSQKTVESTLNSNEERRIFYGQADHYRNFGLDIPKVIEKFGFEINEINGDDFDKDIVPVIGPGKYDYNHIFICNKINNI